MVAKTDIATKVLSRKDGIPSAVTSAMVESWVEDAAIKLANKTGETCSTSDIPTKFQAVITDMAYSTLLGYMLRGNISVGGDVNLSYATIYSEKRQLDEDINNQIIDIIRSAGTLTVTEPQVNW
jgi:hypothetical protein